MYRFLQKRLLLFTVLAMGTTCFAANIYTLADSGKKEKHHTSPLKKRIYHNIHTLPTVYEKEMTTQERLVERVVEIVSREVSKKLKGVKRESEQLTEALDRACSKCESLGEQNEKPECLSNLTTTENQTLRTENQTLRTENQTLRTENQTLRTENQTLLTIQKYNKQQSKNNFRKTVLLSFFVAAAAIVQKQVGSGKVVPLLLLVSSFSLSGCYLRRGHTLSPSTGIGSIANPSSRVVGVVFVGTALLVAATFSNKIDFSRYGGRKKDLTLQLITLGVSMAAGYCIEDRYPYRRPPFPLPPPSGDSA